MEALLNVNDEDGAAVEAELQGSARTALIAAAEAELQGSAEDAH